MKAASFPTVNSSFQTEIDLVIQAEQQVSRILPQIMRSVWSSELSRTLRRALAISESHQLGLAQHYQAVPPDTQPVAVTNLEKRIMLALDSGYKGTIRDLSLTHLTAEIIQHKLNCYENLVGLGDQHNAHDPRRILGAAISDEAATGLFLQELVERFESRELSLL
ncbi:hypothetical protein LZD49_27125 [Dyadobacter sp. CY261]|uniref:hypothetical protein n=1 Tax=Dyadobacter sp. CY261 TaxID=2907203 RepID=UPI001F420DC8|nr:hypothetical protein [Dyadobacter sp. CY261]MCF0074186.1 hypothetical protein [Dyadobacter sp. CY261]